MFRHYRIKEGNRFFYIFAASNFSVLDNHFKNKK